MPSFIVHSIVGREICKKLNIKGEEKDKFFIANLLPDTVQIERDPNWNDVELRRAIQKEKKLTHFRTDEDSIISYPDLNYFLNKYKAKIKKDIIIFGYFFHLYTDYYYFTKFLPKIVTFLDNDYNIAKKKIDNKYVKINKTNVILTREEFWGKRSNKSIYSDYNRLNKYLIEKYKFKYNYLKYKKYIEEGKFKVEIAEVNAKELNTLIDELNEFYNKSLNSELEEFKIFNASEVDNLITDIINSFLDKYNNLLYEG